MALQDDIANLTTLQQVLADLDKALIKIPLANDKEQRVSFACAGSMHSIGMDTLPIREIIKEQLKQKILLAVTNVKWQMGQIEGLLKGSKETK